jgi:uncharacterized protein YkwD
LAATAGALAALAAATCSTDASAATTATAREAGAAKVERGLVACANRERRKRGIAPLKGSSVLARAARYHARNMARYDFFDHVDPWGRDPGDRVALFDDRPWAVGENIAAGTRSAAATCRLWMHSRGHRQNILDPDYQYIGGGYARGGSYGRYYVQDFGFLN